MIGVRIHYDLQPDAVKRFNVPALPYLVFTDSHGTELMHQRGLIEADDLTAVIRAMPADVSQFNRLDRALESNKNEFQALIDMGSALRASAFYEASNSHFTRALKHDAARSDAGAREFILTTMARNSIELRDGKAAAADLQRCLKEFPKSSKRAEMLLDLGKAYLLNEKKENATKSLNAVIANYPESDAARAARELLQSR
jgi:hypothetical protein